ncbi:MAG: tubulin-like doman-containing protein [Bradymonadaceae bacterium]
MATRQKLVVDELLTKPSAVVPTLFVGLGGCGCQIAVRVAQHLKRRPDYAERYKDLVKVALVDTNINDLEGYREDADQTFLISDFEKEAYANLASGKLFLEADPYFTQWVPQNYRFRAGDTAGAGQIRIESRLGSFYQKKHGNMVARFRKLLEELKSHEHGHRRLDSSEIRIVLCFSVAGGTGSGSFLPMAYMLRDQARELGKPMMLGVCVLPAVFEDKTGANKDGTYANSYAALKELEHLMKLGAPDSSFYPEGGLEFHYDPSDESKKMVRDKPFEFVYMIDKPETFSVSNPVNAAADGLYLQLFSPLFNVQAGDYDNYTQHQRFLVPHDFEGKGIKGFSSFYGSYGAAVLLVPVPGLVDYCSRAASLSLMRASFIGAIPGDPMYSPLRTHSEPFYEVTERDEDGARPVRLADFVKREEGVRNQLRDRLFSKRVRLLAKCEFDAGDFGRFMEIFRHGQRLGEVPAENGTFRLDADRIRADREQLADRRMNFSIGALILDAVCGAQVGQPPGLLRQAQAAIKSAAEQIEAETGTDGTSTVRDWVGKATFWADDLKRRGTRLLDQGYTSQGIAFPGMEELLELKFLSDDTEEVSIAAKRYFVLAIREELRTEIPQLQPWPGFDLGGKGENEKVKSKDAGELIRSLMAQAEERAFLELRREFIEKRTELRDKLGNSGNVMRVLELGFDDFERTQARQLERLQVQGDFSANQYVLDAEALQIENGRRMWDFYYEDQVSSLSELSMSNPRIQRKLSGTVRDLSLRGNTSTTASLQQLYDSLRGYATAFLTPRIGGDVKAKDPERRDGLTLAEALELEVVYRALYMSNLEDVSGRGEEAIREIVARYRALPPERRLDLGLPLHQDYLRDKIHRVVTEKAALLCSYDDSRDQHGGVRPNNVFLAAIDEDFKNTTIETALRGATIAGLKWVKEGWHNPREIIFYRGVLNVPLYCFGRMDDMKDFYYRFKNMSKRSKVLHIDKNWEEGLPDLDPDTAQEKHRQVLVRSHIINFAALLTIRDPLTNQGYIVHRDGSYLLRDPNRPVVAVGPLGGNNDSGLALLGATMADAIERLPEVLSEERVKYLPYQQLLHAVREGLAPQILTQIVRLPFQWRRSRDELRTQYGSTPTAVQQLRLRDFSDAFHRLQEALEGLLDGLRNLETERLTVGGDMSSNSAGLSTEDASASLRQSVEILRGFTESWRAMEDPEQNSGVPNTFRTLFRPLGEEELNTTLDWLKTGPAGGDEPSARAPKKSAKAQTPES